MLKTRTYTLSRPFRVDAVRSCQSTKAVAEPAKTVDPVATIPADKRSNALGTKESDAKTTKAKPKTGNALPSVPARLEVAAQKMNRRCLAGRERDTVSRLDVERA
jgi:hypothetical protein